MATALIVLSATALLELLLWFSGIWKIAKAFSALLIVGIIGSALSLVVVHPMFASILLLIIATYRCVNLLRVVKHRVRLDYLQRVVVKTSAYLIALQVIVCLSWFLSQTLQFTGRSFWPILAVLQFLGLLVIVVSTERHLRTTRPPKDVTLLSDSELPTLTVAIPARNETEDLEACLASLVASNYPKLEILVLDDCSQNTRTPEIIRGFAHDGVRFLSGAEPQENWLAKNQAYQQLLDAANGEYVLFTGVDSRYEPGSLRILVSALVQKKKSMLSLMPSNAVLPNVAQQDESLMLQPARYAWELSLPRKLFNRPPVLSTCWLVNKKFLLSAGGFAAVSRAVVPESYFARVSVVHDGYSFMQSNESIGIKSVKVAAEQWNTAVRTRYPQLHRRPELVLLMTLAELCGLVLPFILVGISLAGDRQLLAALEALNCLLVLFFYGRVVSLTYRKFLIRGFFAGPFAALCDIVVLNTSMLKYEFSEVIWKGRNVCIPVMRVIPKLPRL
ncbi:MAG: glycosyltransferase [Candidatus Saccharimonadales bacterium]